MLDKLNGAQRLLVDEAAAELRRRRERWAAEPAPDRRPR